MEQERNAVVNAINRAGSQRNYFTCALILIEIEPIKNGPEGTDEIARRFNAGRRWR
jgi:hypothetical protein